MAVLPASINLAKQIDSENRQSSHEGTLSGGVPPEREHLYDDQGGSSLPISASIGKFPCLDLHTSMCEYSANTHTTSFVIEDKK